MLLYGTKPNKVQILLKPRKNKHAVSPELRVYGKFGLAFKKHQQYQYHWHENKATNFIC